MSGEANSKIEFDPELLLESPKLLNRELIS